MEHIFRTKRRIEISDTDMAGIVHFSRFFVFMEVAEHEFLRSLGLSCAMDYEGEILGWPKKAASCEYNNPAHFENTLDIYITIIKMGSKSLTYDFVFENGNVEIARGKLTTVCCIWNPGGKLKAIPIPESISGKIEEAAGKYAG